MLITVSDNPANFFEKCCAVFLVALVPPDVTLASELWDVFTHIEMPTCDGCAFTKRTFCHANLCDI